MVPRILIFPRDFCNTEIHAAEAEHNAKKGFLHDSVWFKETRTLFEVQSCLSAKNLCYFSMDMSSKRPPKHKSVATVNGLR